MPLAKILYGPLWFKERLRVGSAYCRKFEDLEKRFERPMSQVRTSMPIKSSGRIVPPGWAPLQPKQSVLSLIV